MGILIIALEGVNALLYLYFGFQSKYKPLMSIGLSFLLIAITETILNLYFRCSPYLLAIHNYFDVLQLLLWALIFYQESKRLKRSIVLLALSAVTFFTINILFIQESINKLTTHSIAVNYIIIACLCIVFFYEKMILERNTLIFSHPLFWFTFGLFLMNICNAPYWALYNYLNDTNEQLFVTYDRLTKYITVGGYIMCTFIIRWKKVFPAR